MAAPTWTERYYTAPNRLGDPDLAPAVDGILLNPMNQALCSRIAIATAAEYLAAPDAYDPDAAWERAYVAYEKEDDAWREKRKEAIQKKDDLASKVETWTDEQRTAHAELKAEVKRLDEQIAAALKARQGNHRAAMKFARRAADDRRKWQIIGWRNAPKGGKLYGLHLTPESLTKRGILSRHLELSGFRMTT